ncbi:MAG: YcxB family protein [Clostridia bacterium]|nr:YcxB family protein [Clostridia bacterium]
MKPFETFGYLNQKDYGTFVRFNIVRGKYYRVKAAVIGVLIVGAVAALAVAGIVNSNRDLLIAAGALLLSTAMFAYIVKVNVKNICASNARSVKGKQHILFGKNGFIFELLYSKEEDNEYTDVLFDEISKIYETKRYFYIYIDKRTIFIAPKRNLRVSDDEARECIQSLVAPEKFVRCV